jgi:hypothetical protein
MIASVRGDRGARKADGVRTAGDRGAYLRRSRRAVTESPEPLTYTRSR